MAEKTHIDRLRDGLPRDYLRAGLLLLIAESPAHGYDLFEQIGALGFRTNDPGGLYRALRAMEVEGYVESSWHHESAGPPRRTYRLSAAGAELLDAWAGVLEDAARALSDYLARYERLARQRPGPSFSPDATLSPDAMPSPDPRLSPDPVAL